MAFFCPTPQTPGLIGAYPGDTCRFPAAAGFENPRDSGIFAVPQQGDHVKNQCTHDKADAQMGNGGVKMNGTGIHPWIDRPR